MKPSFSSGKDQSHGEARVVRQGAKEQVMGAAVASSLLSVNGVPRATSSYPASVQVTGREETRKAKGDRCTWETLSL